MKVIHNLSFSSGDFTLRVTREWAENILARKQTLSNDNGIFFVYFDKSFLRFSIYVDAFGKLYFTTKGVNFSITDDVIKCFERAKQYVEEVRKSQPKHYGNFSIFWDSTQSSSEIKLKSNQGAHVGCVKYTGAGKPVLDLDRSFVFDHELDTIDLMSLNQIVIEAKSYLNNPCTTI